MKKSNAIMKLQKIMLPLILFLSLVAIIMTICLIKRLNASLEPAPGLQPTPTAAPAPTVTLTPSATPSTDQTSTKNLYVVYETIDGSVKYGYIDDTGAYALQPTYEYALDFKDGLAIVMTDSKYQVINKAGAVLFENENSINPFYNGMASFYQSTEDRGLYGYIDTTGKVVIEPQYTFAGNFNAEHQAYVSKDGSNYELIDVTGKVLQTSQLEIDDSDITTFEDGYAVYFDSEKSAYGVLASTGDEILKANYSDIIYLGHDLFGVKQPDIESYEAQMEPSAIFNAKGEQLTEYIFYDLHPFEGNYTSAANDTSVYFIGTDGKEDTSLPSYEGGGTLTLMGEVVKAMIDNELVYYRLDNTVLWRNKTDKELSKEITVKTVKFKPLRSVIVYYPQVEGMADKALQKQVNAKLEELFTEYRTTITEEDMLTVSDSFEASLVHDLLIIRMSGYDYYSGAAHGMPLQEYYFIDIKTGVFYQLKDLFKADSNYQSVINQIIRAKMKKEIEAGDSMYFEDSFKGIEADHNFYLDDKGLVIYFYPYDIAAYAAGFPKFDIPYDVLDEYINKDGEFWKAFNK